MMQLSGGRRFLIFAGFLIGLWGFVPRPVLANDELADLVKLPMACEPWGKGQVRCLSNFGYRAKAVASVTTKAKADISFQIDSWETWCDLPTVPGGGPKSAQHSLVKDQDFQLSMKAAGIPSWYPRCHEYFLLNCTSGGRNVDCYQMFTAFISDY